VSTPNLAKLTAWIRANDARAVGGWSLRQVLTYREKESTDCVAQWDAGADPDELAREAAAASAEDADAIGSLCQYALCALGDDGRVVVRKGWRVAGESFSDEPGPSEAPNGTGVLAQTMRHAEANARVDSKSRGELFGHYEKALERAEARISQLEQREIENIKLMGELVRAQAKGEIEAAREHFAIETKRRALGKLETLVPLLAAKLTGEKLLPAGKGGDALRSLLLQLEPEQLAKVSDVLTPEQRATFLEVWAEADRERGTVAAPDEKPSAPVAAE
jgi:hypothetical protein